MSIDDGGGNLGSAGCLLVLILLGVGVVVLLLL